MDPTAAHEAGHVIVGEGHEIRVHEAGHAVLDHLLGMRVTEVVVHAGAGAVWARFDPPTQKEPERSDYLWARIVGVLGGEAAELHLLGRASRGSSQDQELARYHALQIKDGHGIEATIADCRLVAARLVREHEAAIRGLAQELGANWGRLAHHGVRDALLRLAGEPLVEHRDPLAVSYERMTRRRDLFERVVHPGMTDAERQAAWDDAERAVTDEEGPPSISALRRPVRVTSIRAGRGRGPLEVATP